MAKDKGGHGSEKRGGSGPASYQNVSTKPLISNAAKARIAGWAAPGAAAKANNATWRSAPPSQIEQLFSGGGQPVMSDAHAAATLAGGPKSASVDTHPAMREVPMQPRDRSAAHNAGPNGLVRSNKPYRGIGS